MKPHKNARLALKALHIAGTKKSKIKLILPDISQAIESISTDKASIEFLSYFVCSMMNIKSIINSG